MRRDPQAYSTSCSWLACLAVLLLSGCGGTKLLREPRPLPVANPLAEAADARLAVRLDWVIVRNAESAWARNADWDEYHLVLRNLSVSPLEVTRVTVRDSLGSWVSAGADRKDLVRLSRSTVRRYRHSGLKVKAGVGGAGLIAAGVATTLGMGTAYVAATAYGAALGGTAGGVTALGAGLLLAGPAVLAVGVVRAVNNSRVDQRIQALRTELPLTVEAGSEARVVLFFPLAPSPSQLQVRYRSAIGSHVLDVDTRRALDGLHLAGSVSSSGR